MQRKKPGSRLQTREAATRLPRTRCPVATNAQCKSFIGGSEGKGAPRFGTPIYFALQPAASLVADM
jgi:hypothetical protein